MTLVDLLWLLAGAVTGAAQVALLARAARTACGAALGFLPRLLLAGGLLFAAAWQGHLLAAVLGWPAGFAGAGLWLWWRWA